MAVKADIFSGRSFTLITGASQGLGRSLAIGFASAVDSGSAIALSARNAKGLEETLDMAKDARKKASMKDDVRFITVPTDLADSKQTLKLVDSSVSGFRSSDFSTAFLIHNAGTLGDISKEITDFEGYEEVASHLSLNIAHVWPVTAKFLKWRLLDNPDAKTVIINVSSLLAIQATPCFSQYCTIKAARDMLFWVLATENPKLRVLNWAPGPLDTAMTLKIRETSNRHNTDKDAQKMKDAGQVLNCEQSTDKLLKILRRDEYKSGSHVDYYD